MIKIYDLPVYMLGSFGHAGIDWTHSLLDNHKQILIMPAFSFFRTLYKIEKINGISIQKLSDNKYASEVLTDIFYLDDSYRLSILALISCLFILNIIPVFAKDGIIFNFV